MEVWKEFMDYHKNLDSLFTRRENGHLNFETYIKELIKSNSAQVLVVLDKEDVVGYSISLIQFYPPVFKRRIYGLINDLAVKESHRRKGLGEQMLFKMFQWFESHGLDRIELRVSVRNKIAYSFWKKHGFKDYQHILYLKR
ncbi:MAG: GNAT family N-acetyltransferase [Candidatus Hodarchaeota archaeon]